MTRPGCFLEAAGPDDVPAISAIERNSFSHPWSVASFEAAVTHPERGRVLVLRARAAPSDPCRGILGYSVFQAVAGEAEIHDLAVDPRHRGRGLGRLLLGLTLGRAARRGATSAVLEVRQTNWPAVRLYRSFGFDTVAVRRAYYTSPPEDALVLRKELLHAETDP